MGLPGLYQLDAMHGPQWRHTRLSGVRIADVGFRGVQVLAGRDRRRPGPQTVFTPPWLQVLAAAVPLGR
jgi:hypothetical protein